MYCFSSIFLSKKERPCLPVGYCRLQPRGGVKLQCQTPIHSSKPVVTVVCLMPGDTRSKGNEKYSVD